MNRFAITKFRVQCLLATAFLSIHIYVCKMCRYYPRIRDVSRAWLGPNWGPKCKAYK